MATKDTCIIRSTEQLAEALNLLEASYYNLKYRYDENPGWDRGLLCQLEDASAKLGYALATLVNWDDDEVGGTDGEG
jgi:hypothetical protein